MKRQKTSKPRNAFELPDGHHVRPHDPQCSATYGFFKQGNRIQISEARRRSMDEILAWEYGLREFTKMVHEFSTGALVKLAKDRYRLWREIRADLGIADDDLSGALNYVEGWVTQAKTDPSEGKPAIGQSEKPSDTE